MGRLMGSEVESVAEKLGSGARMPGSTPATPPVICVALGKRLSAPPSMKRTQ